MTLGKVFNVLCGLKPASLKLLLLIAVLLCVTAASAFSGQADSPEVREIIKKLETARSDFDYKFLGASVIPGYLRVSVEGGPILHVSLDGSHFFDGAVYQVTSSGFIDVESIMLKTARQQAFSKLDTSNLIVFAPIGRTSAVINVFTDIDCGYCRKLHLEVDELNSYGIEVRYLAYPRAGLESDSYDKIATAWCAEDPQDVLTRLKRGETLPMQVCSKNPVAEHFNLGRELGVNGTPAVVLMDGTMIPGYRKAKDFAIELGLVAKD